MPGDVTRARRIVVDALAARFGGNAEAAIQVARCLSADPLIGEVIVVTRAGSIVADGVQSGNRLRVIELRAGKHLELARRLSWEAAALPRLVAAQGSAVLSWSGMLPRRLSAPTVCYLGNSLVFQGQSRQDQLRRWAVGRTARMGAHLAVPSAAMSDLAAEILGRPPHVVALGVDHERFRPAVRPGDEVLCVADFYAHKRHELLLAAWAALPPPRPTLRLLGDRRVDPANARDVERTITSLRGLGTIIAPARVRHEDVVAAYHRARVLVVPSERESFLMPLLEAQACGVPGVVRDMPTLRETGGRGTTYVTADDPAAWAEAISRLIRDEEEHARARNEGHVHSLTYSWHRTAAGLRDLLLSAS